MPITLTITIESPISEEDRDLLNGVATFTLAVAAHESAKGGTEEETDEARCGLLNPADPSQFCVGVSGHRGRHRFRDMEPPLDPMPSGVVN